MGSSLNHRLRVSLSGGSGNNHRPSRLLRPFEPQCFTLQMYLVPWVVAVCCVMFPSSTAAKPGLTVVIIVPADGLGAGLGTGAGLFAGWADGWSESVEVLELPVDG